MESRVPPSLEIETDEDCEHETDLSRLWLDRPANRRRNDWPASVPQVSLAFHRERERQGP